MLTVDVGPSTAPPLTVVMLHGYAMEPESMAPFARSLGVAGRYHFPRGACTAPGGGAAWWPVDGAARAASLAHGPRDLAGSHPQGRAEARAALAALLRAPALCPPGGLRVLAGFSQGGMLACDTLLHEGVRVDGLALFSASRIAFDEWQPRRERLAGLPVLVAHGHADTDLHVDAGRALHDWVAQAGARARWLGFDGGHEMPLPVWRGLRQFLHALRADSPVQAPSE